MSFELLDEQYDPVVFHWAGATYQIRYDSVRTSHYINPPRWYGLNPSLEKTERYYSSPVGAFTAIYTGSAKWMN